MKLQTNLSYLFQKPQKNDIQKHMREIMLIFNIQILTQEEDV